MIEYKGILFANFILGCASHAGIYGFFNLTQQPVRLSLEDAGGCDIQEVLIENGEVKGGPFFVLDARKCMEMSRRELGNDQGVLFRITFNYTKQDFPIFKIETEEGKAVGYTLSSLPKTEKSETVRILQDFGSFQSSNYKQYLEAKEMEFTYMAIVLEPAMKDGSQGIEKEKASSQKSSSSQEEDVNNDSAAEVDEVKYKNTTDEQHVVTCCQIY